MWTHENGTGMVAENIKLVDFYPQYIMLHYTTGCAPVRVNTHCKSINFGWLMRLLT